jgi:hypothetical protein
MKAVIELIEFCKYFAGFKMLQRTLTLRSVRRIGVFHVVQPAGQALRQKSKLSSVAQKSGSAENKANNQREEAP